MAAASGADPPAGVVIDGFDWWPAIRGESASPREEMFRQRRNRIGARVGRWKWVVMDDGAGGLFDLDADIGESRDLSVERPDTLDRVRRRYRNRLREMEAAKPRGPFRDF